MKNNSWIFSMKEMRRRSRGIENDKNIQHCNIVVAIKGYINSIGPWYDWTSCKLGWWSYFGTICYIGMYFFQVIEAFLAKDDKERLFECFSVICFCGMGLLKLNLLRSKYPRWVGLNNQIAALEQQQLQYYEKNKSSLEYESDEEEGRNEFSPHIFRYNDRFNKASTILLRIYISTIMFYVLSPFVEYTFRTVFFNDILGYPHILPIWAPLDRVSFLAYLPMTICEAAAAMYCVFVHTMFDLIAVGMMIFICGQFYLLRHCSERIGGKGKICNVNKKRDARARFRIKKYHQIHIILIDIVTEFKKLIMDIMGVYFFLATFSLCSIAVRIKTETMSKLQLATLIQYMSASLVQLFLLCYYGDAVYNESSVVMGQGPFGAAVWCLSPSVRRDLQSFGAGMMRSHALQAGPFNVLNLPSFVQIVRTAYSCYAMIGQK